MGQEGASGTSADVMRAMVSALATGEIGGLEAFVDVTHLDHQGLPHIRPIEGVDGFRHVVEVARSGYVDLRSRSPT